MAEFLSRQGKKERWLMANGNEIWLRKDQIELTWLVYDFLEKNSDSKNKRFTTSAIAKGINKSVNSTGNALFKLAFKATPYVRIVPDKYLDDRGIVRTVHKYELVNKVEN